MSHFILMKIDNAAFQYLVDTRRSIAFNRVTSL